MNFQFAVMFAVAVVVAGGLGFAFRGAISKEIKAVVADAESIPGKLESFAKRLETGSVAEVKAVAADIRALLAKL